MTTLVDYEDALHYKLRMRPLTIPLALILLLISVPSQATDYSVDGLIERAKSDNYSSQKQAQRLFRAGHQVTANLNQVIPAISLGTGITAIEGNYYGLVASLVGFIFPSNWFRLQESRFFLEAEKRNFITLVANQINGIENLSYALNRDKALLQTYQTYVNEVDTLLQVAQAYEQAGEEMSGFSYPVSSYHSLLDSELVHIENLTNQDRASLIHASGLPDGERPGFKLKSVPLPDLLGESEVDPRDLCFKATSASQEIASLKYLRIAARFSKRGRIFRFLTPTASLQDSFGFGYFSNIKVGKSQIRSIDIRQYEQESLICTAAEQYASHYNSAIRQYEITFNALTDAEKWYSILKKLFKDEGEYDSQEFLNAIQNKMQLSIKTLLAQHQFLAAQANIERLLWAKNHFSGLMLLVPNPAQRKLTSRQRKENRKINRAIRKGDLSVVGI